MKYLLIGLMSFSAYSNEVLTKHLNKDVFGGLKTILEKRYLRVLTTKNPYDYFIKNGKKKGLQYEMAREFVKYLNKKYPGKLRIVFEMIPVEFDQLIPMLQQGKGDIIALGLTHTPEREKLISLTKAYRKVSDVIVTRKELAHNDWKGKTFYVQKNSSFSKSLTASSKNVIIHEANPNFHSGYIMELISLGLYDYTLVNSFWANTIGKRYKNLAILKDVPFRKNIEISWGVRKEDKELLEELNTFLPLVKRGSLLGNIFSYKYFYNVGKIQSDDFDLNNGIISKYDHYFKKYAKVYNLDWRLIAAISYQESRFRQDIENKWGAIGLFQIKQQTASEPYINIPYIKGLKNIENNVHAGVKYFQWIKKRYFNKRKDMTEEARIRMSLASYNAGPGRVLQAIKKTKQMGLDPNKWFRNVELGMLQLGVPEPVLYVSEINKHYVSYLLLGIK